MSTPKVDSEELAAYIKALIAGVSDGANSKNFHVTSGMRFHIGISNETKTEAGAEVIVARIGRDKSIRTDSFVEFEVAPKVSESSRDS